MVMKSELATTHFATSCTCWCAVVVECINHLFTGGAKFRHNILFGLCQKRNLGLYRFFVTYACTFCGLKLTICHLMLMVVQ
jgi:hypothetical protein